MLLVFRRRLLNPILTANRLRGTESVRTSLATSRVNLPVQRRCRRRNVCVALSVRRRRPAIVSVSALRELVRLLSRRRLLSSDRQHRGNVLGSMRRPCVSETRPETCRLSLNSWPGLRLR